MAEDHLKSVTTLKTEADLAREIKDELRPLAERVAIVMEKAARLGMQPNYTITPNAFGKFIVSEITVMKQI